MSAIHLAMAYLAVAALIACTPSSVTPTPPDASDAAPPMAWDAGPVVAIDAPVSDVFDIACANLAVLACPEADRPDCAAVMRRVQTSRLTDLAPGCIAMAKSADAVRACAPSWKHGCRGARTSP